MRDYEVVFIIRGAETDEAADALVAQMEEIVKAQGAELTSVEKWGRRRLAYDIGSNREGFYVLFVLRAEPGPVAELERRLKMEERVIRFLSVRLDEETRRARRRAGIRARRKGADATTELNIAMGRRPKPEVVEEEGTGSRHNVDEAEGEA